MSFFGELRRRNVVKVAVAYAIVGWLLIEVSSVLLPAFEAPDWVLRVIVLLIGIGFILSLVLSWAYELTPEGMKKAKSVPLSESVTKITGRKLDFVIIGVLVVAVAFFLIERSVLNTSGPFAGAEVDPASLNPSLDEPPAATEEDAEEREVLPNSVAVLPFENLSLDPENAFFAAGIHEEVLNQLVKLSALNVIARTSMMQYADGDKSIPQVAEELNVETVMEGSVRYADGRVLVTAQLIDPETNAHLWSDSYNREFADVFAIQSDIAMNIANALEAEFSLEEQAAIERAPTESSEAYSYYLRAIVPTGPSVDQRLQLLDQATEIDPEFALAYAQKAFTNAFKLVLAEPQEAEDLEMLVRDNAERALDLDPALAIAQAALAVPEYVHWRGLAAEQAFQRAIALSPNDVDVLVMYGRFKRYRGEFDQATRLFQRAIELDPNALNPRTQLAINYRDSRQLDAAAAAFQDVLARGGSGRAQLIGYASVEAFRGNSAEAVRQLQLAENLPTTPNSFRLAQMAHAYAAAGRPEDAMRLFGQLQGRASDGPVGDANWVRAYIAIGNYEQALLHLEIRS